MQHDVVRGGVPVPLVTQPSDSARILFLEVTCKRLSWRWASVVSQTCVIRPCRLIRGGIVREQWGMNPLEPALSGGVHTERAEWDQAAARRRTRPIRAWGGDRCQCRLALFEGGGFWISATGQPCSDISAQGIWDNATKLVVETVCLPSGVLTWRRHFEAQNLE